MPEPERIPGAELSPSMFGLLGVSPAAGRFFKDEEGVKGDTGVVVLSHRLWQQRFSARRNVLGTVIHLDGRPHEIVGIAPSWFYFPDRDVRLWTPYVHPIGPDTDQRRTFIMSVVGRLRPGATLAQVEAEGSAAARDVPRPMSAELMFGKGTAPQVRVRRLVDVLTHQVRPALLVVTAAVSLVLLLACANIANLLLARGLGRTRELAVRAALGAGRRRLLRHVLSESVLLSIAGGIVGTVLAMVLIRALPAWAPRDFPRLDDIRLDAQQLAFTLLVTLASGVLAGILPALRASGTRPHEALRAVAAGR